MSDPARYLEPEEVAREQLRTGVVCPDDHRVTSEGTYRFDASREELVWARCHEVFRTLLERPDVTHAVLLAGAPGAGKSTHLAETREEGAAYFDATMADPRWRDPLLQIAQEVGKPVDVLVFDTSLETCLERNRSRGEDRRVPEHVVRNISRKLERRPPSISEGFRRVARVSDFSRSSETNSEA